MLKHLVQTGGWDIVAVSRRTPDVEGKYEHLAADLADPTDCHRKLARLKDVSHVFFAAYLEKPTPQEAVSANLGVNRIGEWKTWRYVAQLARRGHVRPVAQRKCATVRDS